MAVVNPPKSSFFAPLVTVGANAWLPLTVLGCLATTSAAVGAFMWLIQLPPGFDCRTPATLPTDRAQLVCAQSAAADGNLEAVLASLDLVDRWGPDHPLHQEVQPAVDRWSQRVLAAAQAELAQGNQAEAVAYVQRIPPTSPVYAEAQQTLMHWQALHQQGQATTDAIQTALAQQDWASARAGIRTLGNMADPYWHTQQVRALTQQVQLERQGRQSLRRAVALASAGGPDQLAAALETVRQIEPKTHAWTAAQAYRNRWSASLLKLGLDRWYANDLDWAMRLGRQSALDPDRVQGGQDLVRLSEARRLARRSLAHWPGGPRQGLDLYRAVLMANHIAPTSPVYPQAQSSVATWRQYLVDLGSLHLAQGVGQFDAIFSLELAIDQAQQIPVGHPRRQQAQTLVAHWQRQIQRIEDRPTLVAARSAAQPATRAAYHQAIDYARRIGPDRALRSEAQGLIYQWQHQIQILEDRPLLDRARALATQRAWSQAIAVASEIRPGRALYPQAEAAIRQWQADILALERVRERERQAALAAAQRAARRRAHRVPVPPPTPHVLPERQPVVPASAASPAPVAPVPAQPSRPSLPSRIETVPGDSPVSTPVVTPVVTPAPAPAPSPLPSATN